MEFQQPILPLADGQSEATAQNILSIARRFDVDSRIERSLKWNEVGINWHRFLVALDAKLMNKTQLTELFNLMGMPVDIQKTAKEQSFPSTLLLGLDAGKGNIINKLYYEYWDKVVALVKASPEDRSPILLNIGFKWQTTDTPALTTTYYHCYPLLNVSDILARIGNILPAGAFASQVVNLITIAARRVAKPSFVYMEATEDNGRLSFDLNVYQAELPLSTIRAHFHPSSTGLAALTNEDQSQFSRSQNAIIGHISAGKDRCGETFLTLYYEAQGTSD